MSNGLELEACFNCGGIIESKLAYRHKEVCPAQLSDETGYDTLNSTISEIEDRLGESLTEAEKRLDALEKWREETKTNPEAQVRQLRAELDEVKAWRDKYRSHSATLNHISWRMASFLGRIPEGAMETREHPTELLDLVLAKIPTDPEAQKVISEQPGG